MVVPTVIVNPVALARSGQLVCNDVETQAGAMERVKPRRFLGFTKEDVGWLLFTYVVFFLCFRFDIRRHGGSFTHPMTAGRAASIAVPFAIVTWVLVNITRRKNPVSDSHFTSLSLDDTDTSTRRPRVNDNDMRS